MFLSFKKCLLTTALCLTFFALFGFGVYANSDTFVMAEIVEESTSDDVLDYFNYSDDFLVEYVNANEANVFSAPLFTSYDREIYRSEIIKDLGPLQLSTGFERDRLTTFSTSKAITGLGEEGAVVGLHVFHIDKILNDIEDRAEQVVVSTQDRMVTLGKSGLYNETVCFDYVGVNYVLLTVENPVTFEATRRLYKVTLKELETRNKLENMTINFFEEEVKSPSIEEFVPGIVDFGF